MFTIIMVGVACLLFGAVGGMIFAAIIINAQKEKLVSDKVVVANKVLASVLESSAATAQSFREVIGTQDKIIQRSNKEIRSLKNQLDAATEEIAGMSEMTDEVEDNEDEEDKSEGQLTVIHTHRKTSTASDKLITIQKLLEDAATKKESVDPVSLLGIIKFTKD